MPGALRNGPWSSAHLPWQAAVLSEHMKVVTVEREPTLAKFARKHLPKNVRVVEGEIAAFLRNQAGDGKKARRMLGL